MRKLVLLPLAAFALAGCSSSPAPQAKAPAAASTAISDSNPLKPLFDDRAKAKAVQKTVDEAAERQRKAIEAAGG